jgi:hypothetical protein
VHPQAKQERRTSTWTAELRSTGPLPTLFVQVLGASSPAAFVDASPSTASPAQARYALVLLVPLFHSSTACLSPSDRSDERSVPHWARSSALSSPGAWTVRHPCTQAQQASSLERGA